MDGQSVGAGISFGIAFTVFVIVATGFFRQAILWTVDDKIRAERDQTRQELARLQEHFRSTLRELERTVR